MAISGNRIVATTAKRDGLEGTPPPVCSKIVPVAPPASYYDPSLGATVLQPAEYEGQVRFVENGDQIYTMYVVVNLRSLVTDCGNFTTATSLAVNGDLYDGGNFTTGFSLAWNEDILDGAASVAVLEWKPCGLFSRAIDSRTGRAYDPLAGFYNVLAN